MRIKHANLPHVAVWRHLTGIDTKSYYIVLCFRLIIGTFWAQPMNILSREEQDFTSQDANSHQRLSWTMYIFLYQYIYSYFSNWLLSHISFRYLNRRLFYLVSFCYNFFKNIFHLWNLRRISWILQANLKFLKQVIRYGWILTGKIKHTFNSEICKNCK